MQVARPLRRNVSGTGTYVAIPGMVVGVEEGIKHLLKMEFRAVLSEESTAPYQVDTVFSADRLLIDFSAFDPSQLSLETLRRDCELVLGAIEHHSDAVRQLAEALRVDVEGSIDFDTVADLADQIGIAEAVARANGGGLWWVLALMAGAALASGCRGCKTTEKAKRKKGKNPDYD